MRIFLIRCIKIIDNGFSISSGQSIFSLQEMLIFKRDLHGGLDHSSVSPMKPVLSQPENITLTEGEEEVQAAFWMVFLNCIIRWLLNFSNLWAGCFLCGPTGRKAERQQSYCILIALDCEGTTNFNVLRCRSASGGMAGRVNSVEDTGWATLKTVERCSFHGAVCRDPHESTVWLQSTF